MCARIVHTKTSVTLKSLSKLTTVPHILPYPLHILTSTRPNVWRTREQKIIRTHARGERLAVAHVLKCATCTNVATVSPTQDACRSYAASWTLYEGIGAEAIILEIAQGLLSPAHSGARHSIVSCRRTILPAAHSRLHACAHQAPAINADPITCAVSVSHL